MVEASEDMPSRVGRMRDASGRRKRRTRYGRVESTGRASMAMRNWAFLDAFWSERDWMRLSCSVFFLVCLFVLGSGGF